MSRRPFYPGSAKLCKASRSWGNRCWKPCHTCHYVIDIARVQYKYQLELIFVLYSCNIWCIQGFNKIFCRGDNEFREESCHLFHCWGQDANNKSITSLLTSVLTVCPWIGKTNQHSNQCKLIVTSEVLPPLEEENIIPGIFTLTSNKLKRWILPVSLTSLRCDSWGGHVLFHGTVMLACLFLRPPEADEFTSLFPRPPEADEFTLPSVRVVGHWKGTCFCGLSPQTTRTFTQICWVLKNVRCLPEVFIAVHRASVGLAGKTVRLPHHAAENALRRFSKNARDFLSAQLTNGNFIEPQNIEKSTREINQVPGLTRWSRLIRVGFFSMTKHEKDPGQDDTSSRLFGNRHL